MKFIYLLLLVFGVQILTAQTVDSLSQPLLKKSKSKFASKDSTLTAVAPLKKKKRPFKNLFNFKKDYPSPKKAVLLSAILPGTGQIYNKKYWKLPIVYGGIGWMVYLINFNTKEYKRFRTAYIYRLDDDPLTIDEFSTKLADCTYLERLDDTAIKAYRDQAQKNKELSYIGLIFIYVLAGVDSYVDAHLVNFDVNDDLTLQVSPDFRLLPDRTPSMGIGVGLKFKETSEQVLPVSIYE